MQSAPKVTMKELMMAITILLTLCKPLFSHLFFLLELDLQTCLILVDRFQKENILTGF